MKSGGSIFIVVLLIVSSAAAQATQPAGLRWASELDHSLLPPTAPAVVQPPAERPSRPNASKRSGAELFASVIAARERIQRIAYQVDYARDVHGLQVPGEFIERRRRFGKLTWEGTRLCYFLDERYAAYDGKALNPVDLAMTREQVFVSPEVLIFWAYDTDYPSRRFFPLHESVKIDYAWVSGKLAWNVIERWGFGLPTSIKNDEDSFGLSHLEWYLISEDENERVIECWNSTTSALALRIYVDSKIGLIKKVEGFGVHGELYLVTECTFAQVTDSSDSSKVHWIPQDLTWREWRQGRLFNAKFGRVSNVRVNDSYDCSATLQRVYSGFPPSAHLFDVLSDGSRRVMAWRDGTWVDQHIPAAPPGVTARDPTAFFPLPEREAAERTGSDSDKNMRGAVWLIVLGAILVSLAIFFILRGRKTGRSLT